MRSANDHERTPDNYAVYGREFTSGAQCSACGGLRNSCSTTELRRRSEIVRHWRAVLVQRTHSPASTANTRTGSSMPLSACSPRSSNVTPADVRASSRIVPRDQDLARLAQTADARGDVHGAAVDVVVLADDVAGVQTDVQSQFAARPRRSARGLNRLRRRREHAHHAVAEHLALDWRATGVADRCTDVLIDPHVTRRGRRRRPCAP